MVSTLDSDSSDPGSNPGRTYTLLLPSTVPKRRCRHRYEDRESPERGGLGQSGIRAGR